MPPRTRRTTAADDRQDVELAHHYVDNAGVGEERGRAYRPGDTIRVTKADARALAGAGLVRGVDPTRPEQLAELTGDNPPAPAPDQATVPQA